MTDIGRRRYVFGDMGTALDDLTDPEADRLLFWDDNNGRIDWLTLGNNLSITDTILGVTNVQAWDAQLDDLATISSTAAQIDSHLALLNEHIDWTLASQGTIDATNIQDKFLRNDGDDTTSGTITAAGTLAANTITDGVASLTGGALTGLTNFTVDTININGYSITASGGMVIDCGTTLNIGCGVQFGTSGYLGFDVSSNIVMGARSNIIVGTTTSGDIETAYLNCNELRIPRFGEQYVITSSELQYLDGQDQAVKTTSSPTFNAITATSIIIGANTLNTAEWALLDGVTANKLIDWTLASQGTIDATNIQDKFLRNDGDDETSGSLIIDGVLGVGTSANNIYAIAAELSSDVTYAGMYGNAINTDNARPIPTALFGVAFNAKYIPSGVLTGFVGSTTMLQMTAALAGLTVETYADETKNITITEADGFRPANFVFTRGAGSSGALTITSLYNFNAIDATLTNGATITTQYAFYDSGMTTGSTNWGFGINTNSYINAWLRIGSAVAPTCELDVTGSGKFSGTLDAGTSCEADAYTVGGVAGADGNFTSADGKTVTVVKGLVTSIV
jgi:hypothetical protein